MTAPLPVGLEVDRAEAEALMVATGAASMGDAVALAFRAGVTALNAEAACPQRRAVEALFRATPDEIRQVMKLNSAGR